MKKIFFIFTTLVVFAGILFFWQSSPDVVQISLAGEKVEVFKTPECGCCGVYVNYLSRSGVEVEAKNVSNFELGKMKEEYGIPQSLSSCHTSFVAGYAIEGHISLEVIEKLLTEKPDIKGIALPGMPSGTPGMPGPKTEDWVIYATSNDGEIYEFIKI